MNRPLTADRVFKVSASWATYVVQHLNMGLFSLLIIVFEREALEVAMTSERAVSSEGADKISVSFIPALVSNIAVADATLTIHRVKLHQMLPYYGKCRCRDDGNGSIQARGGEG